MYIAQLLKKKNIGEYLLYMWQVEDTIRAYGCSLSRIRREYISQFGLDGEKEEEEADWWGNLIAMMNREGCREQGHLQINKVTMQKLSELHAQLLDSPHYPFYSSQYYKTLPYIVELRNRGAHTDEGEVETCFNALYGLMMLRLKHKDVSPDTKHAMDEISKLMGMLGDYYHKDLEEPLKF